MKTIAAIVIFPPVVGRGIAEFLDRYAFEVMFFCFLAIAIRMACKHK